MIQTYLLILFVCLGAIRSVPLKSSSVRVRRHEDTDALNITVEANGCIFDEKEYKVGEEVPSLGPCERCVCEAPDVVCSMVKCQHNSGCRIIQQSGQCCPEYKCDCEYNGQIYNNGERLDKPDDPCKVCYCKGGEIMCTSVTCYERDDCQPHFSPGQCCPKYDHCPVESSKVASNSVRSVNASVYSPKREMQPWPLTKSSNTQSSVNYDETTSSHNNIYPQTIKIVEILPTTPGNINKPSEVSVIPRVKTNDYENKEELVKNEDDLKPTVESEIIHSTTESFESTPIITSSTSEIEHLLDTTPQAEEKSEKQLVEAIPERSVNTINPLSEPISINTDPQADPQPDSQKMATILPGYFSSVGTLNNLGESTTLEPVTEVEGSGYELLRGGIYEEFSSEFPEYTTPEDNVNIDGSSSNHTSREETAGESKEISNYEVNTTTENSSSAEDSSTLSRFIESDVNNNTSIDYMHSNVSSSKLKSDLYSNSASHSGSSGDSSSEEKSVEDTENSIENKSDSREITTGSPTTNSLEYVQPTENLSSSKQYDLGLEASSENPTDELSTLSTFSPDDVTVTHDDGSLGTSASSLLFTDNLQTSTTGETSTLSSEPSGLTEATTDTIHSNGFVEEKSKKTARLTDGKLNKVSNDSQTSSSLTFPSILKVQSLGADQFNAQTESSVMENTTTMARIGIYHPTKANESAGYLTIVDEKLNTSSGNEKLFSTHILLTPQDLKKLAEILIHEKIKPVGIQKINKGSIQNQDSENPTSVEAVSSYNDSWSKTDSTSEGSPTYDSSSEVQNLSGAASTSKEDKIQEENFSSTENLLNSYQKENISDDPNTSRQIKIPENVSRELSTLLDDRDLRILENFFRKNIGLH